VSDITKVIGEISGYTLGALILYLLYFIQKKIKTKHPDTIMEQDIKTYKSIYEQLSILLGTGADRVYILEFHDGTDFSSSVLQWKLSCRYELVKNGISRMMERLQNLEASSIADYIGVFYTSGNETLLTGVAKAKTCELCTLCKNECSYIFDLDNMVEGLLVAELEMQGIFGMIQVGIRNRKGNLIGILGLDYCSYDTWNAIKDEQEDIPHTLKEISNRITRIWETHK